MGPNHVHVWQETPAGTSSNCTACGKPRVCINRREVRPFQITGRGAPQPVPALEYPSPPDQNWTPLLPGTMAGASTLRGQFQGFGRSWPDHEPGPSRSLPRRRRPRPPCPNPGGRGLLRARAQGAAAHVPAQRAAGTGAGGARGGNVETCRAATSLERVVQRRADVEQETDNWEDLLETSQHAVASANARVTELHTKLKSKINAKVGLVGGLVCDVRRPRASSPRPTCWSRTPRTSSNLKALQRQITASFDEQESSIGSGGNGLPHGPAPPARDRV